MKKDEKKDLIPFYNNLEVVFHSFQYAQLVIGIFIFYLRIITLRINGERKAF